MDGTLTLIFAKSKSPNRLIPALPFAEAPKTAEWPLRYMAQLSARCRLTIG